MTDRIVTALITEDGPLQGAEVRIQSDGFAVSVDVHLDAIGRDPARWVPLGEADQYLADLTDADPLAEVARSHDDRAAARTERRAHDAG